MNIEEIKINDVITFNSLNTTDPNLYYGKVISFMNYQIACTYMDIAAYHSSVLSIVGTTIEIPDISLLKYILLKVPDKSELVCFALEWINQSTLTLIEKHGSLTLDILDITNDEINNVISLLSSNGYKVLNKGFNTEVEY
jgi:hypothetical protein